MFIALDKAANQAGFESATQAAQELISRGGTPESAAIGMLARRISQGNYLPAPEVDLAIYERLYRQEQPA